MIKAKRVGKTDTIHFFCPGCNEIHTVRDGEGGWAFNGRFDKPTFAPSVLVKTGHYCSHSKVDANDCYACNSDGEDYEGFKCARCHSFIRDGMIQFLNDCTHELAGKTVELKDFPDE